MTFPGSAVAVALSGGWPSKPFSQWGQTEAMQVVSAGLDLRSLSANRLFYLGDHWQRGDGWIGPWPDWKDETAAQTMAEIERGFVSRNVIKEVVERHMASVVGSEPTWGLTLRRALAEDEDPTEEEQALIDEGEAFLTEWWDRIRTREHFQDAVRKLLYSGGMTPVGSAVAIDTQYVGGGMSANSALRQLSAPGRSVMRLYVPSSLLSTESVTASDGTESTQRVLRVVRGDLADALSKIHIDVPEVEMAHVYEDPTRLDEIGVCNVQARVDQQQTAQIRIELTYLDDGGLTWLASVGGAASQAATNDANNPGGQVRQSFDLGKRLLMSELRREPFLSPQVRESQKALNYANSMIPRNVTTGGFLEQIILNGMQPGHWEGEGAERKWVPDPYYRGAGVVNWVSGIEYEDAQGQKHITTPSVQNRAPVLPDSSIAAKRESYRDILEECDQAHILITGEATPSGKSREQSRADFEQSLKLTQTPVERTGRWLIETVLAWGEVLAGIAGRYTTSLRATFDCVIDTGPLSTQERANDVAAGQAGYMSRQTIMSRAGIADPDAELQRIMQQDGGDLEVSKLKAEIYAIWISAGCSEEAAAKLAHLSPDEQKIITQMIKDAAQQQPLPIAGAGGALPGAGPQPNGTGAPNVPTRTGLPQPQALPRQRKIT